MEDSLSSGRATKHQQQNGPRNSHCFQIQVCESKVLLRCADVKLDSLLHIIEGSYSCLSTSECTSFPPRVFNLRKLAAEFVWIRKCNCCSCNWSFLETLNAKFRWKSSSFFFLIAWFNQNLCSSKLVAWMFNMICMIWWKSLMRLSVGSSINSCIQTNAFLIMAWMWTWYMI
jgi:hypothetical protein